MAKQDKRGGRRPRRRPISPRPDVRPVSAAPDRPVRSRWRPGYWRRHPTLSVVLVVLFMGAFVTLAAMSNAERVDIHRDGQPATGTVLSLARRTSDMSVRFTTPDGETVTAQASRPDPTPRVGDQIPIVYQPSDPAGRAYTPDNLPGIGTPLLLLAVGILPGLAYLVYLRRTWGRWRGNAEAWRRGASYR
jgi:hypothetical protein